MNERLSGSQASGEAELILGPICRLGLRNLRLEVTKVLSNALLPAKHREDIELDQPAP